MSTGAWGGMGERKKKKAWNNVLLFSNEFDHLPSVCVGGGVLAGGGGAGRVGNLKKKKETKNKPQ